MTDIGSIEQTTETSDPAEFGLREWSTGCADWGAPTGVARLRDTFLAPPNSLIDVGNVVEGDLLPPMAVGNAGQNWLGGISYPVPNCHVGATWRSLCQTDADGVPCDPTKDQTPTSYLDWHKVVPEVVMTPPMCVPLRDVQSAAKMGLKDQILASSMTRETWWQAEHLLWTSECNGILKDPCIIDDINDGGVLQPAGPALDRLLMFSSLARIGSNMILHLPRWTIRQARNWGSIVADRNGRLVTADGKLRVVAGDGYLGSPDGYPDENDGVGWAAITGPTYTWASAEWGFLNDDQDPAFHEWRGAHPQRLVQRSERSVATAHLSCEVPMIAFDTTVEAC